MKVEDVPIPRRMRKRPRFNGMVIPYTTWINPATKIPDFKVNDERRRELCVTRGWCAMCGMKMNEQVSFIGGKQLLDGVTLCVDAGMHPECARYAWNVCPYIVTGRGHAEHIKDHSIPGERVQIQWNAIATSSAPPERMGIMITNDYEVVKYKGQLFVRAGKAISVEWREFPENQR